MARYRQSGPIRFGEVAEFFGQTTGTPYSISDFYKGGGIVPATGPNGGQVAVHQIAVDPNASSELATDQIETAYIYVTGNTGEYDDLGVEESFDVGTFENVASIGDSSAGTFWFERSAPSATYANLRVRFANSTDAQAAFDFLTETTGRTRASVRGNVFATIGGMVSRISSPIITIAQSTIVSFGNVLTVGLEDEYTTGTDYAISLDRTTLRPGSISISGFDHEGTFVFSNINSGYSPGLTTSTELRDRAAAVFRRNQNVTDVWTITSETADERTPDVTAGEPIIVFTARNAGDHILNFSYSDGVIAPSSLTGDLTGTMLRTIQDGATSPSEIQISYNGVVSDLILGTADSQGITNEISTAIQDASLYTTTGVNSIRIEDSRQREIAPPTITVLEAGTSALADSDFTVTEVQPGIPTTRTTDYLTIEYSTDDVSATTTGWNFQSSITGPTTTFTTWPSTGDIFLHVGLSDVVLDDLETTLGLTEITQTMQDVTDATLTFHYRFLDLVDATTTYDLTGIRLVSSSSGTSLGLRLDGTTEVQSTTNTDPLFADEQVVGLAFFRRQMGDINTDIPDDPMGGTFPPLDISNFYNANDGSTT